jgi:hypothetical protein
MSKLTRRSLVTTAAALPALAVPAVVAAAATGDDTSVRIAEHRRIYAVIDEICDRLEALEEVLPEDRRKAYGIDDRGTDVGWNDDPRWTAVQAEFWAAEDRKDEIAWSFVDRPPTTIEGVAAILAYGEEYEEAGNRWPMFRFRFTAAGAYAGKTKEDWHRSLNRAIIPVLCAAPFPTAAGVSPMPKAGADAELLQLGVQLEPIEREWKTQLAAEKAARKETGSGATDCDWDDLCDRIATLCNDILSRKATTIAGLAVQTRALGLTNGELWYAPWKVEDASERIPSYFRSVQRARARAAAGPYRLTPRPAPAAC